MKIEVWSDFERVKIDKSYKRNIKIHSYTEGHKCQMK